MELRSSLECACRYFGSTAGISAALPVIRQPQRNLSLCAARAGLLNAPPRARPATNLAFQKRPLESSGNSGTSA